MHTGCIPIVISKCFANIPSLYIHMHTVSLYTHDKVRVKCMLTYPADCDCWNMLGGRYPWPSSLAFTSSSPFDRKLNWGMPRLLYHLAFVQCSLLECLFSIQLALGYSNQINPTSLQIYNGSCSMDRVLELQICSSWAPHGPARLGLDWQHCLDLLCIPMVRGLGLPRPGCSWTILDPILQISANQIQNRSDMFSLFPLLPVADFCCCSPSCYLLAFHSQ